MILMQKFCVSTFLSTLSLRRATNGYPHTRQRDVISIHALLAESDRHEKIQNAGACLFLSTLSLRRATINGLRHKWASFYFYPRSPCGERPWDLMGGLSCDDYFYPRSPCGERRVSIIQLIECGLVFLSTLSLRRATNARPETRPSCAISIHALLAESDPVKSESLTTYFISIHALLAESD